MASSLLAFGMSGSRRLTELALLLGAVVAAVLGLAAAARAVGRPLPAVAWVNLLAAALVTVCFVLAIVALHWGWKG